MAKIRPLTKPHYSPEQLAYFFRSAHLQGQVTTNKVVYHYMAGELRTVVMLRDSSHSDEALIEAKLEIYARDPSVSRVTFVNYPYNQGSYGSGVMPAGGVFLALSSKALH